MTTYEAFQASSLDTEAIGLNTEPEAGSNVLLGVSVIGWMSAGGIHFCLSPQYGETVFCVDPASPAPVHAVAGSFSQFLGLIIACGGTEAIARIPYWSRWQFNHFLAAASPTKKQQSIFCALKNIYAPPVIQDPVGYILELQKGFDYHLLKFCEDYSEWCAIQSGLEKWEVRFRNTFWFESNSGVLGKMIQVGTTIPYGEDVWHIPAVYSFKTGLVADFCVEIQPERLDVFLEKWQKTAAFLTKENEMLAQLENPMYMDIDPVFSLNGCPLPRKTGCSIIWNPRLDNSPEAVRVLNHYGCDREKCWVFLRISYQWPRKVKASVQTLKLTLHANLTPIPGMRFSDPQAGDVLKFTHPVTGFSHTLTILSECPERLDENFLSPTPTHFRQLTYSVSPEIPNLQLHDCAPSDKPMVSTPVSAECTGIIGGADGPTVILLSKETPNVAASSPHFTPCAHVEWQMIFYEKLREDLTIPLFQGGSM